jgi:hypothetical protein
MTRFKMTTVQGNTRYVLQFLETKCLINELCHYVTQYGKDPPSNNLIRSYLNQFQETGSVLQRERITQVLNYLSMSGYPTNARIMEIY